MGVYAVHHEWLRTWQKVSGQVRALRFPLIQPRLAFKTTRHVACGCRHLRPKVPPKTTRHVSGILGVFNLIHREAIPPSSFARSSHFPCDPGVGPELLTNSQHPKICESKDSRWNNERMSTAMLEVPPKKEKIGAWSERWDILTPQKRSKKYHK